MEARGKGGGMFWGVGIQKEVKPGAHEPSHIGSMFHIIKQGTLREYRVELIRNIYFDINKICDVFT